MSIREPPDSNPLPETSRRRNIMRPLWIIAAMVSLVPVTDSAFAQLATRDQMNQAADRAGSIPIRPSPDRNNTSTNQGNSSSSSSSSKRQESLERSQDRAKKIEETLRNSR